jgi:hypothetical protein
MSGSEHEEEEEVIPPKYCTPELIKENLSQVGKTFDGDSYAFLTLNLSGQGVCNLSEEVGGYSHLRFIDLGGNKLPDIDGIKGIPHILTLNVAGSELTSIDLFNSDA